MEWRHRSVKLLSSPLICGFTWAAFWQPSDNQFDTGGVQNCCRGSLLNLMGWTEILTLLRLNIRSIMLTAREVYFRFDRLLCNMDALYTHTYPCIPLFTSVHLPVPFYTLAYPCILMYTHIYLLCPRDFKRWMLVTQQYRSGQWRCSYSWN